MANDGGRRGRLPWGLVGMVGLAALIEAGIAARSDLLLATDASMSWRHAGHAAWTEARRCDILCFGDSQVQFQVLPTVIERRTGRRAYNLGLFAGPVMANYFQLRHALAAGARPSAVVVDFQANSLWAPPEEFARLLPEVLTAAEVVDVAWTDRDAALLARLALGRSLPSARVRHECRAAIAAALRGDDPARTAREWRLPWWRNWNINRGSTLLASNPGHRAELILGQDWWLLPDTAPPHFVQLAYMGRFLDLAAAHGLRVYWFIPPVHPTVLAVHEQRGLGPRTTAFARERLARYPNLSVIDARPSRYPAATFADLAHLDARGAALLSADLGDLLREQLARPSSAPRWAELPAYRDRPIEMALEDLERSRQAVRTAR